MSESKVELERTYTVPLSRAWIAPRYRRTSRAVNVLKEFAIHHMKSSEIKIDSKLNERLWNRGITKPPRRITVTMSKDEDGLVTISLPKIEEELGEEPRGSVTEKEESAKGTSSEEISEQKAETQTNSGEENQTPVSKPSEEGGENGSKKLPSKSKRPKKKS
jgi:large subunit ribosomal protein L31e